MKNKLQLSVGELLAKHSNLLSLFEEYSIDYCCKGNRKLSEVINEISTPDKFISKLNSMLEEKLPHNNSFPAETSPPSELCDYIVNKHHSYVKSEIPEIEILLRKVIVAHSKNHPKLNDSLLIVNKIFKDIKSHLDKEEKSVFPVIRYLAACEKFKEKPRSRNYKTINNYIKILEDDHSNVGNELEKLRKILNNYTAPSDACNSYILLLEKLEHFEKDLHAHVHLENNILFPKSIKLEKYLTTTY
jgi:regulator of cell morphogenesis and NO signaling